MEIDTIKLSQENRQRVIDKVDAIIKTGHNTLCAGLGKNFTCSCQMEMCKRTYVMICHGCVNAHAACKEIETFIDWD